MGEASTPVGTEATGASQPLVKPTMSLYECLTLAIRDISTPSQLVARLDHPPCLVSH